MTMAANHQDLKMQQMTRYDLCVVSCMHAACDTFENVFPVSVVPLDAVSSAFLELFSNWHRSLISIKYKSFMNKWDVTSVSPQQHVVSYSNHGTHEAHLTCIPSMWH